MAARPVASTGPVGRRPGTPDTRGAIVDAARAEFAKNGYGATSMRGVARAAGVDPALVHHYFDSKEDLFFAVVNLPFSPREEVQAALQVPPDEVGKAIVRLLLRIWDDPVRQPALLAVVRSSTTTEAATNLLRDGMLRFMLEEIARVARIESPQERMPFVATQVIGLIFGRYVLRLEPLASMPPDDLIAKIGPVIQHYLTD